MREPNPADDPLELFRSWLQEAELRSGLDFPNAMSLSTVGSGARPSSRMVLLKGLNERGFLFFTNFESRKGRELDKNASAALCFYWEKLGRSVRVEGHVEKVSREESQAYFDTRARESRLGAWASAQSQELASRAELEQKLQQMDEKFRGQEQIPVPPNWGGFCVVPDSIEFWVNGPNRLHDRFVFNLSGNGKWTMKRLAP